MLSDLPEVQSLGWPPGCSSRATIPPTRTSR